MRGNEIDSTSALFMPNACMMTSQSVYFWTPKILMTLTNLMVFSTTEPFKVKVNAQVAGAPLNDAESEVYSEFIEHLADDDLYLRTGCSCPAWSVI